MEVIRRVVGIFWDGENVAIPRTYGAGMASNDIDLAVGKHGSILDKSYYYGSQSQSLSSIVRNDLAGAGWRLVDCPAPTCADKETVDKKIIVDVMMFVHQHDQPGVVCTVVLLSGDGDYSYMISRVKGLGVNVVVIYDSSSKSMQLFSAAGHALCWKYDVLRGFSDVPRAGIPVTSRFADWCLDEVAQWLQSQGLDEVVAVFRRERITGGILQDITEQDLQSMGLKALGDRRRVIKAIADLNSGQLASNDRSSSTAEGDGAAGPGFPEGDKDDDSDDDCGLAIEGLHRDDESCSQMAEGRSEVFLKCLYQVHCLAAQREGPRRAIAMTSVWVANLEVEREFYRNYGHDPERYRSQVDVAQRAGSVRKRFDGRLRITTTGLKYWLDIPMDMLFHEYKTKMCCELRKRGSCASGSCCNFAHGQADLRDCPSRKCSECQEFTCMTDGRVIGGRLGKAEWRCGACFEQPHRRRVDGELVATVLEEVSEGCQAEESDAKQNKRGPVVSRLLRLVRDLGPTGVCPGTLIAKYQIQYGVCAKSDIIAELGPDATWWQALEQEPGIVIEPHTESDWRISFRGVNEGDWRCATCGEYNFARNSSCRKCEKFGDWLCSSCGDYNFGRNSHCRKCSTRKT